MQAPQFREFLAAQVNETAPDDGDDYYNYINYVDNSGGGDSATLASTSSHYYDYLLPKLDQLTAPTDTLIRDFLKPFDKHCLKLFFLI